MGKGSPTYKKTCLKTLEKHQNEIIQQKIWNTLNISSPIVIKGHIVHFPGSYFNSIPQTSNKLLSVVIKMP